MNITIATRTEPALSYQHRIPNPASRVYGGVRREHTTWAFDADSLAVGRNLQVALDVKSNVAYSRRPCAASMHINKGVTYRLNNIPTSTMK